MLCKNKEYNILYILRWIKYSLQHKTLFTIITTPHHPGITELPQLEPLRKIRQHSAFGIDRRDDWQVRKDWVNVDSHITCFFLFIKPGAWQKPEFFLWANILYYIQYSGYFPSFSLIRSGLTESTTTAPDHPHNHLSAEEISSITQIFEQDLPHLPIYVQANTWLMI